MRRCRNHRSSCSARKTGEAPKSQFSGNSSRTAQGFLAPHTFRYFHPSKPHMMTPETLYRLAPPLICLQFFALGWRVNSEINVPKTERQTVIPLPDVINIMSLFATVGCLVVLPMVTESYYWLSRIVLGSGYVLIAFYPFTVAAHYGLWTREVPSRKTRDGAKPTYVNREELITSIVSVVIAGVAATYMGEY
jgi:hypothetical protein